MTLNSTARLHGPVQGRVRIELMPSEYQGDGSRFQKFAFEKVGEIDFIVAGALTPTPFEMRRLRVGP